MSVFRCILQVWIDLSFFGFLVFFWWKWKYVGLWPVLLIDQMFKKCLTLLLLDQEFSLEFQCFPVRAERGAD